MCSNKGKTNFVLYDIEMYVCVISHEVNTNSLIFHTKNCVTKL